MAAQWKFHSGKVALLKKEQLWRSDCSEKGGPQKSNCWAEE